MKHGNKTSDNTKFLRSRSLRGQESPVLTEHTPSKLNIAAQQILNLDAGPHKKVEASTLPRRASSVLSGSLKSVQHHTLHGVNAYDQAADTPEWRRRLARGEDVAGDGCDLFAPSRLEGIFKQPPPPVGTQIALKPQGAGQSPSWSMPTASPSVFEQYQSMRASRTRLLELDVLEEVSEDDNNANNPADSDTATVSDSSVRRLVRQRVTSIGQASSPNTRSVNNQTHDRDRLRQESRSRTISGQEELRNEWISPITLSKQNTIRDDALGKSLDRSAGEVLQVGLKRLGIGHSQRPSSSSSDQDVKYWRGTDSLQNGKDDLIGNMTSLSLPDDLSVGTQEFIAHGGYINNRRGEQFEGDSFRQRALSSSVPTSRRESVVLQSEVYPPGSPQLCSSTSRSAALLQQSRPSTPQTFGEGVQDQSNTQEKSGSPLKLFGVRDTYTNNKLLRVLSHFEDDSREHSGELPDSIGVTRKRRGDFRMSQFGVGDLDQFGFHQTMQLETLVVDEERNKRTTEHLARRQATPTSEAFSTIEKLAGQSITAAVEGQKDILNDQSKRVPRSPLKDRTPKRRRTLVQGAIQIPSAHRVLSASRSESFEAAKVAGTKRKDARYDVDEAAADPATLASRQMLRPHVTHRRSSTNGPGEHEDSAMRLDGEVYAAGRIETVDGTGAVAHEMAKMAGDARKPSYATKDYMEEATKIMEMLRAGKKPRSGLSSVEEPHEISASDPEAIPELGVSELSSGDEFSRPPSREGGKDFRRVRQHAPQDPRIISHLQKYKDSEDLSVLESFIMEPMAAVNHAEAEAAALVPIPEEDQHSSPPNVRIIESLEMQRKRKHSASTASGTQSRRGTLLQTQSSSRDSSGRTLPTTSSASSGRKGLIKPETVPIFSKVGPMTFDHASKSWIKVASPRRELPAGRRERQGTSDEDPFEHISDLSERDLDGVRGSEGQKLVIAPNERNTMRESPDGDILPETRVAESGHIVEEVDYAHSSLRPQTSDHEARLHKGQVSQAPSSTTNKSRQPRVVTIAFSSPIISAVTRVDECGELDLDDQKKREHLSSWQRDTDAATTPGLNIEQDGRHNSFEVKESRPSQQQIHGTECFVRRPVSRIEEVDEEINEEMSLIPLNRTTAVTPMPGRQRPANMPEKVSSMICLTPLSEFSVHQVDRGPNTDTSYVASRKHPSALRQAHGSAVLAIDDMMRAITDAEPDEPYWDHLRHLDLIGRGLTALHNLDEYCQVLEKLSASKNRLRDVLGLPSSLRILTVQQNHLSSMTSWSHLYNLQYLDISGNEVEGLEGLACLYHLRELDASNNMIRDIDPVLDLDGLQCLSLRGNDLQDLDFEGGELTRLVRLDASRNHIASVHGLEWLPSLTELSLEHNDLREWAPADAQLQSLKELRLSDNRLTVLDLALTPNVKILHLDRNAISKLFHLADAHQLDTLSIQEQAESRDIVSDILTTPNDCQKLVLSSNVVAGGKLRLPSQPLFSLRHLEIASCGISSMRTDFGLSIPNCRVLNLNFNAISSITQLQGMHHLNKLCIASNRVERLRRTCLAIARHASLTTVDVRNNPLTIGFYAPNAVDALTASPNPHRPRRPTQDEETSNLTRQDSDKDSKWMRLLDEGTMLRRRTMELMLAQGCPDLSELNGLRCHRDALLAQDSFMERLKTIGVLQRPLLLSAVDSGRPTNKQALQNRAKSERNVMNE